MSSINQELLGSPYCSKQVTSCLIQRVGRVWAPCHFLQLRFTTSLELADAAPDTGTAGAKPTRSIAIPRRFSILFLESLMHSADRLKGVRSDLLWPHTWARDSIIWSCHAVLNSQLSCTLFVNEFSRCWSFLQCYTGSCTKLGSAWDTFSNFPKTYLSSSHRTCLTHCSWAPCAPPANISPCMWCLSKTLCTAPGSLSTWYTSSLPKLMKNTFPRQFLQRNSCLQMLW